MRKFIPKFIKIPPKILASLLGLLIIGAALYKLWPYWWGRLVCICLLILMFVIIIRKLWVRHREKHFVEQVIEQDDRRLKSLEKSEKERSKELQNRWKEAMETLRRSHLRRHGNPLYVLPWYLVFGESGSGKTTAIKSARLSSPFAEYTRTEGISGTRNCDWWFFENAIIIDTAGRYAIPVDEGRDKEEWHQFLSLLAKFRRKEPLNGLVITVSADKLLSSEPEEMKEEGRSIRLRIDQLMAVLGAKFPVYLLVTKCDLIQGMTQFCDHLPEKAHDQAMGFMNRERTSDALVFLDQATATVEERLKELRLQLLHKSGSKSIGRDGQKRIDQGGLLVFPEEFSQLKPNLKAFILGAFQENPFQETPILRGLFYSSGRQEGTPYSHFLRALGLIEEREVLPGTNRGLFLHDFFSRILPRDRRLFTPTHRALRWKRLRRNISLIIWCVGCFGVAVFWSFSLWKNLSLLKSAPKPPVFQGDTSTKIYLADRFRQEILDLEKKNRSWLIRFGLHESKDHETELKAKYCEEYDDELLQPLDEHMHDRMARFSAATDELVFAQYVDHITRRINLLDERLQGADLGSLQGLPQPSFAPMIDMVPQDHPPELERTLSSLYLYGLSWRSDSGELTEEMKELKGWLKQLLNEELRNLHWLTAWVNANSRSLELTLADFWLPGPSSSTSTVAKERVSIRPAYTSKGKESIDDFVEKEITDALPEDFIITRQMTEFENWYQSSYLEAWYDFATVFSRGTDMFTSEGADLDLAERMPTDEGPYFLFLDRMFEELEPFSTSSDLPRWVERLNNFERAKSFPIETGAFGETDQSPGEIARKYQDYRNALNEIVSESESREIAFQMATEVFKGIRTDSESLFVLAHNAAERLLNSSGILESEETVLRDLVTGPFDYLWDFWCKKAACYLQSKWEEEVLFEVKGISNMKEKNRLLWSPDGSAWKFINGPAAPFISRDSRTDAKPKHVFQKQIPFTVSFIDYIGRRNRPMEDPKSSYYVSIETIPVNTNREAKITPHLTRLMLECANKDFRLVNEQFERKETFEWSPETCGDVTLEIEIGDAETGYTVLRKEYNGEWAFPEFLKDFVDGKRTFRPQEFPNEAADLRRFGITEIMISYEFQGQEPVLKLIDERAVPDRIAECWDR